MTTLHINFNHPVKGIVTLKQLVPLKPQVLNIPVNSETSNQIEIPTDMCTPGKWMMTLNWQYDGRSFSYYRPFEISAKMNVFCFDVDKRTNLCPGGTSINLSAY